MKKNDTDEDAKYYQLLAIQLSNLEVKYKNKKPVQPSKYIK